MINRRDLLLRLAGAIGAAAIPKIAIAGEWAPCEQPRTGPYADYFPNVVVQTHEGQRALFYNDLLRGKTVLVHCMSIAEEMRRPGLDSLREVQCLLGDRAGRDVFIYSLTVEPERDTPRALAAFAERQGTGPGWLFVTGRPEAMHSLRGLFFADAMRPGTGLGPRSSVLRPAHGFPQHLSHPRPEARGPRTGQGDCSLGMLRYGNEAVGLWGAVPLHSEPRAIVERLSWVAVQTKTTHATTRGGPPPLRVAAKESR